MKEESGLLVITAVHFCVICLGDVFRTCWNVDEVPGNVEFVVWVVAASTLEDGQLVTGRDERSIR